jgi:hypothetical protein
MFMFDSSAKFNRPPDAAKALKAGARVQTPSAYNAALPPQRLA